MVHARIGGTFLKASGRGRRGGTGGWARPAAAQAPTTLTVAWDTDIDSPTRTFSIGRRLCRSMQTSTTRSVSWKVRPIDGMGVSRSFPGEFEGSLARSWALRARRRDDRLKLRPGMDEFPGRRSVTADGSTRSTAPCSRRATCASSCRACSISKPEDRGATTARSPSTWRADAAADAAQPDLADDHHRARSRAGQAERDGGRSGRPTVGQAQCGQAPDLRAGQEHARRRGRARGAQDHWKVRRPSSRWSSSSCPTRPTACCC